MSSTSIEPGLSREAIQVHLALASLQEELKAIDFYHQRVGVSNDTRLKAVLIHNRDDEIEHAMMLLEWLRFSMPGFDVQIRKQVFQAGSIPEVAAGSKGGAPALLGPGLGFQGRRVLARERQS